MIESYKNFWKKYFDFSGKSNRPDYWWPYLVNFLVGVVLGILTTLIPDASKVFSIIDGIYGIAIFIPSLSVFFRRLRDGGHSWANVFWIFLPIVGEIILIVKLAQPSK